MADTDPQKIGKILEALKADSRLGQHLDEAQIFEQWETIVGARLAGHGRPLTVRDGTLIIEAENAVWMHKLSYHRAEIISKINTILTGEQIADIFFALKQDEDPGAPQDDG